MLVGKHKDTLVAILDEEKNPIRPHMLLPAARDDADDDIDIVDEDVDIELHGRDEMRFVPFAFAQRGSEPEAFGACCSEAIATCIKWCPILTFVNNHV